MSRPTLALAMISRNAEKIIGNCLRSVLPYVDEFVLVDTGSTDGTVKWAVDLADEFAVPIKTLHFDRASNPASFLLDVPETWDNKLPGPYTNEWMFADFGKARNLGWSQIKSDYAIWLDTDDVLENGANLPALLNDMKTNAIDVAFVNYDYDTDRHGNVTCKLMRERVVRMMPGMEWKQPVHEVLHMTGVQRGYPDLISVKHQRHLYGQPHHHRFRNLKILLNWFKGRDEETSDPRMLFYLAIEEKLVPSLREAAIAHFQKYCTRSGWDEERGVAHQLAGTLYEQANQLDKAFAEFSQAAMEFRWSPDSMFGAARIAYFKKDWVKCVEWSERGFHVLEKENERQSLIHYDPLDRTYRSYVFYGAALVGLGRYEDAKRACLAGLKINPGDPHLKGNLETAEAYLEEQKAAATGKKMDQKLRLGPNEPLDTPSLDVPQDLLVGMVLQTWKKIFELNASLDNLLKALAFLQNLPESMENEKKILEARQLTEMAVRKATRNIKNSSGEIVGEIVRSGKDERSTGTLLAETPTEKSAEPLKAPKSGGARRLLKIGIWTGRSWEPWTPKNLLTGIGGSETAAICMGRELAKLGHHVQVFGDCKGQEGMYDGVEYIHWEGPWNKPDSLDHDVLIVSRQTYPLKHFTKVKSKFLWVHDVHVGSPADVGDAFSHVDRIFTLSNWHRDFFISQYPILKKGGKVIVTRNGIDVERFSGSIEKRGNRLIYTSSPDRGLEKLLEFFPLIKVEVPDAELHVYYGFKTWTEMSKGFGQPAGLVRIKKIKDAISNTPGVVFHDRVGQPELAKAFMEAKVWAYPTWFNETSCITAMEAQAAECVPVTTGIGALLETVKGGFLLAPPETTEVYKGKFVEAVVALLKNEKNRDVMAKRARSLVIDTHGWNLLAPEWSTIFEEILTEKSRALTPGKKLVPAPLPEGYSDMVKREAPVAAPPVEPPPRESRLVLPKAVAPATDKPMRIAVILGKLGAAVHGTMDIENLFDGDSSFVTGTVSGFVNVAWGLGERGHQVDAFCDAKETVLASKYGGVNFYPLNGVKIDVNYDAYISVNEPDVLREFPKESLKVCAMWLNDFSYCRSGWDENVDVYACPSQTHLDYIAASTGTSREKLDVVPLSINPEFYDRAVARRPGSMAYCSSPDRGLHVLLEMFPQIRRRVPGANLRIYYRFKPWLDHMLSDSSQIRNPSYERALSINDSLIRLGSKGENGVLLVGPLPPKKLIDELRATRVMAYPCSPTRFTEGFSVTVMDGCMSGCVPVIAGVDALTEVYGGAAHVIHGDPRERMDEWVEAICLALTNDEFASDVRLRSVAHAQKFTRQKVAVMWEKLLRERRGGK